MQVLQQQICRLVECNVAGWLAVSDRQVDGVGRPKTRFESQGGVELLGVDPCAAPVSDLGRRFRAICGRCA
jgi:hypothetical protein